MDKWEPIFWIWLFGIGFLVVVLALQSLIRKRK
jgi:hypothetical protein